MKIEGCKCFTFGKDSGKQNRTIMVIGGTGSGKTTLVNRMINYILGVTAEDTFRFKLDEGTAKSQAHSQTSEVNVYKLYHEEGFQIDNSLTIVDTPGFGDTRGKERDELTVSQIEKLFRAEHGVSEIDAICFVAEASSARLTKTQKYVFDSVLKIFGNDVEENIQIMVTFSDGNDPPVLEAIKVAQVPCPKGKDGLPIHFKFNNTVRKIPAANNEDDTSDDDENEGDVDKLFWKKGNKSMARFFSALHKINPKSLTLTKQVLRERAQLQISLENLRIKIKMALTKHGEIKQESLILKAEESVIAVSGEFEYEVPVTRPAKLPGNKNSVNCKTCKVTCHKSCGVIWGLRYWCEVFTITGTCVQCKCGKSKHVLEGFYWGTETVTEKRTFKDLKIRYEEAYSAAMSVGDIITKMQLEYQQLLEEAVRLIERSAQCLNTLKKIALRPDPLSTSDYIDMLIEEEKSKEKPGYLEIIETLEGLKTNANTKEKVSPGVGTSPSAKNK
ncbi:unnamed protein product [Gadus morhua 'NCC']